MIALPLRRRPRLVLAGLSSAILLILAACSAGPRGGATSATSTTEGKHIIAWAPPPADTPEADQKAAGELVGIFTEPCIGRFPDDDAVSGYAQAAKLTPMTAAEVREILKSDPGVGWVGQSSGGPYKLTIEKPPYHTCAVREVFAGAPIAVKSSFSLLMALWAVGKNYSFAEQPTQFVTVNGLPTTAYPFLLTDASGKTLEQLAVIVTDLSDGKHEVRLVRQILAA